MMAAETQASGPMPAPELEQAEIHTILSNDRRIEIVDVLADQDENDESMTRSTLARELAAREVGVQAEDVDSEEYRRAYIAIYQTHLPKLDEYGVIREERDTIEQGPNFAAVRSARNAVALTKGVIVDGE